MKHLLGISQSYSWVHYTLKLSLDGIIRFEAFANIESLELFGFRVVVVCGYCNLWDYIIVLWS